MVSEFVIVDVDLPCRCCVVHISIDQSLFSASSSSCCCGPVAVLVVLLFCCSCCYVVMEGTGDVQERDDSTQNNSMFFACDFFQKLIETLEGKCNDRQGCEEMSLILDHFLEAF